MQIWDTAGQEKFDSIVTNYYHSTDYGIFVYSIDDQKSFRRLDDWLKEAEEKNTEKDNKMKSILLGNKKDLEKSKRVISYDDGQQYAEKNNFMLFKEISCKDDADNEVILEIFDLIAKDYYINYELNRGSTELNDSLNYEANSSILEMSVKQIKKRKCC